MAARIWIYCFRIFLQVNSGGSEAVFAANLVRCVRYSLIRIFAETIGAEARDE
jgi:hypothetical protein